MNSIKNPVWFFLGSVLLTCGAHALEPSGQQTPALRQQPESRSQSDSAAREQPLRDAEALLKAGRAAEAYALLEPLEFERSGEPRFDYLIGIAALDSGQPDKATLAFERALAVNPNFVGARLDNARAYYQLGDLARAKKEFEITLKLSSSETARRTIRKYLDEIEVRQTGQRTRFSGYIEGALGRDNNVNNSTSQTQISIPLAGNAVASLDPTNIKTADNYYGVAAGGEVVHSLNPDWGFYAGGALSQRGNNTQTSFDVLGVNGRAGVLFGAGDNLMRVGLSGGQYNLGKVRNRDVTAIDADWRHVLSPSNQLNVFAQANRYRYADVVMKSNDFDQQLIGAGWVHVLPDGQSSLTASLYHGTENDVSSIVTASNPNGGRSDGAKRFSGVRVGGQTAYGDRTELFAVAGAQAGDYRKINAFFLQQRADRQYDLTLGANWHWDRSWTFRPQLAYVRNNSNIVIYGYSRVDASITLRRDFK